MKRVMCGKTTMAYQNVGVGKAAGTVVYKIGTKSGQQQGPDGSPRTTNCKVQASSIHHQTDSAAAWNILALSMYIRSQSPDSNSCVPAPSWNSGSIISSRASSEGGEKSSSSCCTTSTSTSSMYSELARSLNGEPGLETRSSTSSSDDKVGNLLHKSSDSSHVSFGESCSAESGSSDEEKPMVSHFRGQFEGGSARLMNESYDGLPDSSSRLYVGRVGRIPQETHMPHMGGPELSSSSSSSIGGCDDSPCSSGEGSNDSTSGDMEVESAPRGGPLHHMSALEASLPVKRGLSRFWNGKAKSFTSLAEVSSIEELAKPENPYNKRRRITTFGERHKSFPPLSRSSTAGICKRPTSTSGGRSGLAMAVAMGSKLEEAPKHQHSSSDAAASRYSSRSVSLTDLAQASPKAV